jgi:hypothetical protein
MCDDCACGVGVDINTIFSLLTYGVRSIENGEVNYQLPKPSGFGYYVRDVISKLIRDKRDEGYEVELHGSEAESVIYKYNYGLDVQLFGLPRYGERLERAMFVQNIAEFPSKYGIPQQAYLVTEPYKYNSCSSFWNVTIKVEDYDLKIVDDVSSGQNCNSFAFLINDEDELIPEGYTSYLTLKDGVPYDMMDYDYLGDRYPMSFMYSVSRNLDLDFPFLHISKISENENITRGLLWYKFEDEYWLEEPVEYEIILDENDVKRVLTETLKIQKVVYEERQFRNIITRYSVTDLDMYDSNSDAIKIALFASSNIENFDSYKRLKNMTNVLFMFPSAEWLRQNKEGKYDKKFGRNIIIENGFKDFGLYNDEAYQLRKNWICLNQLCVLIHPDGYIPEVTLYNDFTLGKGFEWNFVTDLFDLSIQHVQNSASLLIKSVSTYIRSNYSQLEDDLHLIRLGSYGQLTGFSGLFLDKTSTMLTRVKGELLDVSGHTTNMVLMGNFMAVDWFGYIGQVIWNIKSFRGEVEPTYTVESNGYDNELWHTLDEDLRGIRVGRELSMYFKLGSPVIQPYLKAFRKLNFPDEIIKHDRVNRNYFKVIQVDGWEAVLMLWLSNGATNKKMLVQDELRKNGGIVDANFMRRVLPHLISYSSAKRTLTERINVLLKDRFEGMKIYDVGGYDRKYNIDGDIEILDIETGFDLDKSYKNLPIDGVILLSDVLHHISKPKVVLNFLKRNHYNFIVLDHMVDSSVEESALNMYHVLNGWEPGVKYLKPSDYIGLYILPLDDFEGNWNRILCYLNN